MTRLRRHLALAALLALAAGCATTPEPAPAAPDGAPPEDGAAPAATAEFDPGTPDIPDKPASALGDDEEDGPGAQAVTPVAPEAAIAPSAKAAFERGVTASREGNLALAEKELKDALSQDGKLVYAWINLGVVYERRGDDAAAKDAYERALEVEPDHEIAWDYLTRLRCRTGRASDVEAKLRIQIQKSPEALGPRIALVYVLLYQKKYETAANEAKKVLKADERNVRAMQLLAQVYYREKKYELAKMVLENALAINRNDPATYNALGLVSLALKSKPQAIAHFRQAVMLQPDFAEANNNYGALLNEAHDYEAAAKVLEMAVRAAPDFAAAHLNLANAYRGLQQFDKAIAAYQKVASLRPEWADTYYNLAILHLDSELPQVETIPRLKQAIAYFEQYRKMGGRDENVEQYVKDAHKGIEREERRLERLERDKLKRAEREAEEKRLAEEKKKEEEKKKAEAPVVPAAASKLGEDEEAPPAPVGAPAPAASGKLGEDEK